MIRIVLACLTATFLLSGAAQDSDLGQNAAGPAKPDEKPAPPTQRYRFSHSAEGVLRLDNETGQVTLCRPLNGSWVCNPAPEESALLKVELDRKDAEVKQLTAAVGELKDQVSHLKEQVSHAQDARSQRHKAMEGEVTQLKAAIGALKNDIGTLGAKVAGAAEAGKGAISQDERHDLVSRLALLEQDNSGLKGALARLENDNAKLKKQVEANVRPDLESAVTQAIAANEALKRDLAAANEQIDGLKKQLADDTARRALGSEISQARDANDSLKRELATTRDQVAALQKQVTAQSDRSAQDAEIARLKDDNGALADRLAALETDNAMMQNEIAGMKPPPPLPKAEVPPDKKDELKMPSREEMERARAALTDAWQKLMDMIGQLQKDMMGSRDEPPVRL
jgi:predicted  nucleic acid-binding Zn-ribbon protein